MNREELIEEAAKAMYAPRAWTAAGEAHQSRYRSMVRSALAVFEQAQTPTEAHAKPFDTSPERSNIGADSLYVTPTDDEREPSIEEVTAAFQEHEGAPTWQDDPVARDAALRWHMRGFKDGLLARRSVQGDAPGWSTDDRREAMAEGHRRFDEWATTRGPDLADASINGFALGAEWQKARTVQGEPTPVRFVARQGGKAQSTIDVLLAQANEHGIRVEVVYPQGEPTDAEVLVALDEFYREAPGKNTLSNYSTTGVEAMRRALRAAAATQEGEN